MEAFMSAIAPEMAAQQAQTRWYPLQPSLWPEAGISTELGAYFHLREGATCSFKDKTLHFAPGSGAGFGAYNNLFNLGKWRDICGDIAPALMLKGRGRFQVTVGWASPNRSWERLLCDVVEIDGVIHLPFEIEELHRNRAVLFFDLVALNDGMIEDFGWESQQAPRQIPELVVSITTFRREEAVRTTVERFRRFFADQPLRDHIKLNVVDNGQSVDLAPGDDLRIIPNANLGGAGGFTRGLIEARDQGASHCLFMDDDASVHMESIIRTWLFLAYA